MMLVAVDTTGIQSYIFGTNRLAENVGASHLVAAATDRWVKEALPKPNNVSNGFIDAARWIERDDLAAELVYSGGGNAVVLTRDENAARVFLRSLSRRLITQAPGLDLVAETALFEWSSSLANAVRAIREALDQTKRARQGNAPLLGLSVTAACASTGLTAVAVEPESGRSGERLVSAETKAKTDAVGGTDGADVRLRDVLPLPDSYRFPKDLDHLGRSLGDQSSIAVVHADGDGVGDRVIAIGNTFSAPESNRAYIQAMRTFSISIQEASETALRRTIQQLFLTLESEQLAGGPRLRTEDLHRDKEGRYAPFRPIVFGGDDVTFVSDGRIGVGLAVAYLRAFREETAKRDGCGGEVTASAGIAIVKSHYPFARAYDLADQLCRNAKQKRREKRRTDPFLDWQISQSGPSGTIGQIREQYTVRNSSLTLRPLPLEGSTHWRWATVAEGIAGFRSEEWNARRNKVKALRDALRDGPDGVARFLTLFNGGQRLPPIAEVNDDGRTHGWHGNECLYWDAIELLDLYVPLAEAQ